MKDRVPLDRRQFFEYLKVRATTPEAFNSSQMMRIDQLPSCDRRIVEKFKPSWKPGVQVEISGTEVRVGKRAWGIEPDERAFLTDIDGQQTIGEMLASREEAHGLYERCIRLLTILLKAGALDLDPQGHPVGPE